MPNVKKYCLGVEISPVHQMIKKLKMDHLWVYTLYAFLSPAATAAKYYKKNKGGMPVTEILNASTR